MPFVLVHYRSILRLRRHVEGGEVEYNVGPCRGREWSRTGHSDRQAQLELKLDILKLRIDAQGRRHIDA